MALFADADEIPERADSVTLLTLHTAKGLEYDTVFIIGMEEGICPHSRSVDDPASMEEERRLCYVGLTRAKRNLHLVRAVRRTLYGSTDVREPSRFLLDIPPELADGTLPGEKRPSRSAGAPGAPRLTGVPWWTSVAPQCSGPSPAAGKWEATKRAATRNAMGGERARRQRPGRRHCALSRIGSLTGGRAASSPHRGPILWPARRCATRCSARGR